MPGTPPQDPMGPMTDDAAVTARASHVGSAAAALLPIPASPRRRTGRVGALGWSLAWLAIALGVGAAVGVVAGAVVRVLSDASNPWSDVVSVVIGMLAGVLVAMTVWLVAMALATRRFVPTGRRIGVLGWSALAVVASPLLVMVLFALIGSPSAPRGFVVLTALLAMTLAPPALIAARVPGAEQAPMGGLTRPGEAEAGQRPDAQPGDPDGSLVS